MCACVGELAWEKVGREGGREGERERGKDRKKKGRERERGRENVGRKVGGYLDLVSSQVELLQVVGERDFEA